MLRMRIATSLSELDELRPAWESLFDAERQTVFQSFTLNRCAADLLAGREAPYVVFVETGSSAAIIPAAICLRTGRLTLLGEMLFDYRDVLSAGSSEAIDHAWYLLSRLGRPFSCTAVRPDAHLHGLRYPKSPFASAPCVRRADIDADSFRAAHNRLGMLFRRLVRRGVHLRRHTGRDSGLVRAVYEMKAAKFPNGHNNLFLDPVRREFMVACCAALQDRCQIFTLQHDASRELVAALVTFLDGGTRRLYTIYFDPSWAKYSPGSALLYEITAHCLAEDFDTDYLTGEYPYKNRLATALIPLARVEASVDQLQAIAAERAWTAA